MKILVTGISGFIGRNFIEQIPRDIEIVGIYHSSTDIVDFVKEKKLNNVTLYQCDLTDEQAVKNLTDQIGTEFDHCLYLASNVNIPLSHKDPVADLNHTVVGLITFLRHICVKRFVYVSSTAVYEGNTGKVTVDTALRPVVPYCISKLAAEHYVQFFKKNNQIDSYAIIRFSGAFGPYSDHKFMTKLVREIAIEKKQTIEVYGDGTNIINVMYVNDAVSAFLLALQSDVGDVISNLGLKNMTIAQTVEAVSSVFDCTPSLSFTEKIKEQKYIEFEVDMDFDRTFGFSPRYSFEKGIHAFAEQLR